MDLIAGLHELISQMEADLKDTEADMRTTVVYSVRTLKTLIKAASHQPTQPAEGGVSVSIGGSNQPQQPPPPQRPFKGPHRESDPWEEAIKKGRQVKRLSDDEVKRQIIGDLDKPFHRPECQCDQCERWRIDNGRKPYMDQSDPGDEE